MWEIARKELALYPTIAAIVDRNQPAVYTIAIYCRPYAAELRQRSTLVKCKWPPFFPLIQKIVG